MGAGRPKQFDACDVLDKAIDVFWAKGFEGASMTDLVEAMGIGRQSLYDTFGDKQALFLAALERYTATKLRSVIEILDSPGSGLANIRRVFDSWRQLHAQPCRGCLMANSCADLDSARCDVATVIRRGNERLENAFCRAIERAVADGEIQPVGSPTVVARTLANAGHGLALRARVEQSADAAADVIQMMEELLRPV